MPELAARGEPVPVVLSPEPLPVEVIGLDPKLEKSLKRAASPVVGPTGLKVQDQESDPSVPAKTTYQEDLVAQGQRHINLIWERTQAVIAIAVVICNMAVATVDGLTPGTDGEHPVILSSSLFLVIGFYFSRTNHAAIGGVGKKSVTEMPYTGR